MNTRKQLSTSLGAMVLVFGLSACEPEGDAERAGERIDDAAEKAAETLDPEGPAERAGEKIDEATERPDRPPRPRRQGRTGDRALREMP